MEFLMSQVVDDSDGEFFTWYLFLNIFVNEQVPVIELAHQDKDSLQYGYEHGVDVLVFSTGHHLQIILGEKWAFLSVALLSILDDQWKEELCLAFSLRLKENHSGWDATMH